MTISVTQSAQGHANGASATTAALTTSNNSTFVFACAWDSPAGVTIPGQSITDSLGNTLTQIGVPTVASASQTVASPGVFTTGTQSFAAGQSVYITGTPPGGFSTGVVYYVIAAGLTTTSCQLSASLGGTGVAVTSSSACTLNVIPCDKNGRNVLWWKNDSGTATGGSSHTCTATFISVADITVFFAELSAGARFDQANNAGTFFTSPPQSSGSITIPSSPNGELFLSLFTSQQFANPITYSETGLGMTIIQQQTNGQINAPSCALGSIVETASGSYAASWTDGGSGTSYGASIIGFTSTAAGAALASSMAAQASLTASLPIPFLTSFYAKATFTGGTLFGVQPFSGDSSLTASLTNWAVVLLTSPLYTGIGSALDPYLWTTPLPGVGTTLYYDPTFITILPDGEIVSTSNNCTAVIQFNDPVVGWITGVLRIAPTGVAYAPAEASFTATLSGAATQFASAAYAVATLSEAISTSILMTAEGDAVAGMTANLTLAANLATQAAGLASLGATLSNATTFATSARALASLSASLSTTVKLATQALAKATASGNLTNGIRLATNAGADASLTGNLRIGAVLRTSAAALATLQSTLSTAIRIAASGYARASFSGALFVDKPIAANLGAKANFRGALSTGVGFNAQFRAKATFSPTLFYGIKLATLFSAVADLDPELVTLQLLTTPVPVAHQIPGVYQPGSEPWGQFPIGAGGKAYYGIDWTFWLVERWQPGYTAAQGYVVRPFPWTGFEYVCLTAGTTGNYPPAWPEEIGLLVVDGSAVWQTQAVSSASLLDTVVSATYAAPVGIIATPYLPQGQLTPVQIDASGATPGTSYDVPCTVVLASGQFLIGHLVFDVN